MLPPLLKAKPMALLIEGANPRHEHEWEVWATHKLPEDKVLVPGVLDSSCNFVEHPELVAQRIVRYAQLLGRERVIAGTECGFRNLRGIRTGPSGDLLDEDEVIERRGPNRIEQTVGAGGRGELAFNDGRDRELTGQDRVELSRSTESCHLA